MTTSPLPRRINRMPSPEPRLPPRRVIAIALNSVPFEWWPSKKNRKAPTLLSEDSLPVRAVLQALRAAGYRIVEE